MRAAARMFGSAVSVLAVLAPAGAHAWNCSAEACDHDGKHRTRQCIFTNLACPTTPGPIVGDARPPARSLAAPRMPATVDTILREAEFEEFDTERAREMQALLRLREFEQFPHARDTFKNHLVGTWGILKNWGQSDRICRAGLFHTTYGGDLFIFSTFMAFKDQEVRSVLRAAVGEEAEALVWDFAIGARSFVNKTLHLARNATLPTHVSLPTFLGGSLNLTAHRVAEIMVVTAADFLDQLVEINLWRDVQSYTTPSALYPGLLKPEIALYWLSRVLKGIRGHLDDVPPIFNHCTEEVDYADEVAARDLYWEVLVDGGLDAAAKQAKLTRAAALNPFIAEPHVYLAEMLWQQGQWEACAVSAKEALKLFYAMGAHWDKRLPFRQWVNLARSVLARCVRRAEGLLVLPFRAAVVSTVDFVREMERVAPSGSPSKSAARCGLGGSEG